MGSFFVNFVPLNGVLPRWIEQTFCAVSSADGYYRQVNCGLKELLALEELEFLHRLLTPTRLRGPSLAEFNEIAELEYLALINSRFDDSDIPFLGQLHCLRSLAVSGKFTDAGKQKLRELLPECDVEFLQE